MNLPYTLEDVVVAWPLGLQTMFKQNYDKLFHTNIIHPKHVLPSTIEHLLQTFPLFFIV